MTATPEHDEQVYPIRLGVAIKRVLIHVPLTIAFAVVTYYLLVVEKAIVLGIFIALAALVTLLLAIEGFSRMPKSRRFTVAISHRGLRTTVAQPGFFASKKEGEDRTGLVAWEVIERIVLVWNLPSSAKTHKLNRGIGANVLIFRRGGKAGEFAGPNARSYMVGEEAQMVGGTTAWLQMARELIEWGAAKGVPVLLYSYKPDSSVAAHLGNLPLATTQDIDRFNG